MSYIIELSQSQLRAIGKGLHLLVAENPRYHAAQSALQELNMQTHHVFLKPERHEVFADPLSAPAGTEEFSGVYHMPINLKR